MRTPGTIPHVLAFFLLLVIAAWNYPCHGEETIAPEEVQIVARLRERGADIGINRWGHVSNLAMTGKQFSDRDLDDVGQLPQLIALLLQSPRITDAGMKHLNSLKNLRMLCLNGTLVTGRGLSQLDGLERLKVLEVHGPKSPFLKCCELDESDLKAIRISTVTNEGCRQIAPRLNHLPKFRDLFLVGTDIDGASLEHLANIKQLEQLAVPYTNISDAGLVYLTVLKRLERLSLTATEVDGSGLSVLRELPVLKSVTLEYTSVSDETASILTTFPRLTMVCLDKTKVSPGVLDRLQREMPFTDFIPALTEEGRIESAIINPNPRISTSYRNAVNVLSMIPPAELTARNQLISSVDLRYSYIPALGLALSSRLESLDEIQADETMIPPEERLSFINDESLVPLLKLKQLKRLSLTQAGITDQGMKTIAQIQQIEEVGLRKTLITDAGIKELADTPTLTALDLRQTKITDTALRTLERLPNLKSVRLGGTDVTAEGVEALRKTRPGMEIEF